MWDSPSARGPPHFSFLQIQYSAVSKSDQMHVTGHTVAPVTVGPNDGIPVSCKNQMLFIAEGSYPEIQPTTDINK